MLDNPTYYDRFSESYERPRHAGYHKLIDDLQVELVASSCVGRDVLEIGCGTGALLRRIAPLARSAKGVDISPGMLEQAVARGLDCVLGDATALPYANASFDTAYSFKVLAHVEAIEAAMAEVARVLRPGGTAFLEFYNRRSVRWLAKRLAGPGRIASDTDEAAVFTRWDTPESLAAYLPPELEIVGRHGVRVATPAAFAHRIPVLAALLRRVEWSTRDRGPLRHFGGFYVVRCLRR